MIAGARWRDPEQVMNWASEVPRSSHVVVYCVHGHEVSRGAAKALTEAGRRARYLEGGFCAWEEAKGAVEDKPQGANT
jgi:rhodanese-related sulfurtransferase